MIISQFERKVKDFMKTDKLFPEDAVFSRVGELPKPRYRLIIANLEKQEIVYDESVYGVFGSVICADKTVHCGYHVNSVGVCGHLPMSAHRLARRGIKVLHRRMVLTERRAKRGE